MSIFDRARERLARAALHSVMGEQRAAIVESLSTVDLAGLVLAVDELGWQRLGGPQSDNGNDFTAVDRVQLVKRSRLYWHRDPLAKQAARLYVAYALGQGITTRHPDAGTQAKLDAFHADPLNRKLLGTIGQRRLGHKLFADGEVFVAVFTRNLRRPVVRLIDCLQISDLISNPEDSEDVWYIRREIPTATGHPQVVYYRAADADWGGMDEVDARHTLNAELAADIDAHLVDGVTVIHVPINTLGSRGYPLLAAGLDWTKVARTFMEDRATIVHAGAQFAFKKTVKGGPASVNQLAAALRNGTNASPPGAADPNYDRRGPVAGSTLVQNAGVDTEQLRFDTGGENAIHDARLFKLQFLASAGLSEHYFGDASTGNLATATTMERPVELTLQEFQEVLVWLLVQIDTLVLGAWDTPAEGLEPQVPPILNVDVPALIKAYSDLGMRLPAFNAEPLWRLILKTLGVSDIDDAIQQMQAAAPAGAPAARQTGEPVGTPAAPEPPDPEAT